MRVRFSKYSIVYLRNIAVRYLFIMRSELLRFLSFRVKKICDSDFRNREILFLLRKISPLYSSQKQTNFGRNDRSKLKKFLLRRNDRSKKSFKYKQRNEATPMISSFSRADEMPMLIQVLLVMDMHLLGNSDIR